MMTGQANLHFDCHRFVLSMAVLLKWPALASLDLQVTSSLLCAVNLLVPHA